ncbi:MAG: MaoC/PaaZ C-terminal domain-containing protein [Ketobacteraceae bacterium]|nr:MaoC/PaaZ C-terminal domain-containing protein [Ketobacteraceae bacterium]
MDYLENIPFDELKVGDTTTISRTVSEEDVQLFAYLSGDINPLHLDEDYARTTPFGTRIAHGMFSALLVTTAVATRLPGPGTVYRGQEMKFQRPVKIGDTITAVLTIAEKKKRGNLIKIDCEMKNQRGEVVFTGVSTAIAPTEKLRIKAAQLPPIKVN